MNYLILLTGALAPVAILFGIICYFDRKNPEPLSQLVKTIAFGVGSALLVLLFSALTGLPQFAVYQAGTPIGKALAMALYGAALPEEAAKMLMLYLAVKSNPYFDERFDGIVYAACIALGFAGFENILYVFQSGDMGTIVARAICAVPGHYAFGVMMGYFFSLAWFSRSRALKVRYYLLAYFTPVAFHFIYDGILMTQETGVWFGGVLSLIFFWFVIRMHKLALKRINNLRSRDNW